MCNNNSIDFLQLSSTPAHWWRSHGWTKRHQTYKQQRRPIANACSFSACLRRCACSARFEFNSTRASRSQVLRRHCHRQRHANERSARAHEHVVRTHRVQTNAHMHAHTNDLHITTDTTPSCPTRARLTSSTLLRFTPRSLLPMRLADLTWIAQPVT